MTLLHRVTSGSLTWQRSLPVPALRWIRLSRPLTAAWALQIITASWPVTYSLWPHIPFSLISFLLFIFRRGILSIPFYLSYYQHLSVYGLQPSIDPEPLPVPAQSPSSCPFLSPHLPPHLFCLSLFLSAHTRVLCVGSHVVNLGPKLWVITPIMNHHALFRLLSPEAWTALWRYHSASAILPLLT